MREEYQDLLQREIDGLNSADESEHLERLLASNSSVRQTFDELTAVQVAFNSLEEKVPPPHLRASILGALPKDAERVPVAESHTSVWNFIHGLIFQPRPVSLAYAFSIGVLVMFFAWNAGIFPDGQPMEPGLVGTMAPVGSPIIYEQNIFENAQLGTIYVTVRNGLIRVEIRWSGERSATATVEYDPASIYATGVESVMGESSLRAMMRSTGSIKYEVDNSSIDITTLVLVDGADITDVPIVDVWISADGMTEAKHRIPVAVLD